MMTSNHTWSASQAGSRTSDTLSPTRTESGISNLRRRIAAANGDDGGTAVGLGDPFAEIFAAIATADTPSSQPVEPVEPVSSDDTQVDDRKESEDTSNDEAAQAEHTQAVVAVNDELPLDGVEEADVEESEAVALVESETIDEALGDADSDGETVEQVELTQEDDQSESETPVVVAESENGEQETVVDPELIVGATQDRERRQSDSPTEEVAELETQVVEADELAQATAKTPKDEQADESDSDVELSSSDNGDKPTESKVERRRYTNGSEQGAANQDSESNGSSSDAQQDASGEKARQAVAADRARAKGDSRSGGIDISGMTTTSTAMPADVGAAASAAVRAVGQTSASAVTGKAASGGITATNSVSSAGNFSADGAGSESGPGVDSTSRPGREANSSASAKGSAGVDTNAAVQRAKLVQRVSRGFQHLGSGGGQIRMKLAPEQLGSVQLQMNVQNGQLSGRMVTQSDAATQMLREQLPDLRAALENQGIKLQRIDIETDASSTDTMGRDADGQSGESAGHGGQQFADGQAFAGGRNRAGWSDVNASSRNRADSKKANASAPAPVRSLPVAAGRVDLQV